MSVKLRIGVIGAGGTGKSSLALALSKKLNIEALRAHLITRDILKSDGYDYSKGIQVERFLAQSNRQERILEMTTKAEKQFDSFITDRTYIDLASYAIAELHGFDASRLERLLHLYQEMAKNYTHLFVCPWNDQPLLDNKLRTLNPWYQFIIYSLCVSILNRWGLKYYILEEKDTDKRVKEIEKHLERV